MLSISRCHGTEVLAVMLMLSTVACVTAGKKSTDLSSAVRSFPAPEASLVSMPVVRPAAGQLPLRFEANQGQSEERVNFVARGGGYRLELTPTEAILALHPLDRPRAAGKQGNGERGRSEKPAAQATMMHLRLVDANPQAVSFGMDELPGRVNYISGQDSMQWRTNIPTYVKVKYANVYPGIDLVYYGTERRQLEYDFQVAPGADPASIRLHFSGVDRLDVDPAGDLVVRVEGREMRQRKPHVYQEVAGVRRTVAGGYVRIGEREVGFQVSDYDASRPLIIDPVIVYSTYLGGNGSPSSGDKDTGNDIAVDAAGNIYVVGATNSLGRYDTDVFVRKFDPSGARLLYETYLDSNGTDDAGYGIAVDAVGNAYVTGQFGSPMLPGSALGVLAAKLSPTGVPLYQVTFGANSPGYSLDFGADIAVDDEGNAYVVGATYGLGTPFPTTPDAFQQSFAGGLEDAFVVKLNPTGGFVYSTLLGSSGTDEGLSIAIRKVDGVYNVYVTGETSLAGDFPTTPGAFQTTFGGAADAFVTQLNDAGSALVYSTYLGGSEIDIGSAIAIDAAGNAYLTGSTGGMNFPIVKAFQPTYGGEGGATPAYANVFVTKLNPTGSALIYASYMGGGGYELSDYGSAIAVDSAGNAYLTGVTGTRPDIFTGSRFPIVNAFQSEPGGGASSYYPDAFVAKVTSQGALMYSSYLGGNYWDEGHGIALDKLGNVYVTGSTLSGDFPATPNAFQPALAGGGCSYPFSCPDAFVTKIAADFILAVRREGTGKGTVRSTPAGINCGTDCGERYLSGARVTLTATPAAGSTFAGWSGSPDCTDGVVTMTMNNTCKATFTLQRFPLTVAKLGAGRGTVSSAPAGVSCGTDCTESYGYGTVVALTALPAAGSTFVGWSGYTDCADGVVTMNGAKTCTATFALLPPALTVLAPNGGEVWPRGVVRTIRWTSRRVSGPVQIQLSRNGGVSWTTLVSSTANDGVESWLVSGPATTQARLRVRSVLTPKVMDVSNDNFSIR